jgi:hypothetical protein
MGRSSARRCAATTTELSGSLAASHMPTAARAMIRRCARDPPRTCISAATSSAELLRGVDAFRFVGLAGPVGRGGCR